MEQQQTGYGATCRQRAIVDKWSSSREAEDSHVGREPEWISGAAAERLRIHMWKESLSG